MQDIKHRDIRLIKKCWIPQEEMITSKLRITLIFFKSQKTKIYIWFLNGILNLVKTSIL